VPGLPEHDLQPDASTPTIHARRSVTINRDRDEVYRYWRDLDRLPTFMIHLDSVRVEDDLHSHRVANAPAGRHVQWEAGIVEDRPGELIQWRSTDDSDVPNGGGCASSTLPVGAAPRCTSTSTTDPSGGRLCATIAKVFDE
jgi:uncharacterized membrane protein